MCGIVAYTGKVKPNFAAMKFMMILQKKRGTDGVGFVYNNHRQTSHDNDADKSYDRGDPEVYFSKYYFTALKSKQPFENNTVIIHNRSRSKGSFGGGAIHPWVYVKDGVTHFFAHNGTLSNETELEEKYGIKHIKFESDSHLLGYIIVNFGFKVLTEYIGTAAFVYMRTDEPNCIYAWKGASKHLATSTEPEEERPLHYCEVDGGVYFASLFGTLQCGLDAKDDFISEIENNNLIKFDYSSKKLEKTITIYDRSHIEKPVVFTQPSRVESRATYGMTGEKGGIKITCDRNVSEPSPQKHAKARIYYHAGKYFKNGHILTTDENGTLVEKDGHPATEENGAFRLYFLNGLMLKNKDSYLKVKELYPSKQLMKQNYEFFVEHLHPDYILVWFDANGRMKVVSRNRLVHYTVANSYIPFAYGAYTFDNLNNNYTFEEKKAPNIMLAPLTKVTTHTFGGTSHIPKTDLFSSVNGHEKSDDIPFDYRNFKKLTIDDMIKEMDEKLTLEEELYQEELLKSLKAQLAQIKSAIEDLYADRQFTDLNEKNNDSKEFISIIEALYYCIMNPKKASELLKLD